MMAARNMEEEQSLRECEAYVQMHDIQKILKAAHSHTLNSKHISTEVYLVFVYLSTKMAGKVYGIK